MKKTKLTEKSARIPDTRPFQWEKVIKRYIQEVEHQQTESAKATRFAILTQELFGVEPNFIDNYVSGIEKYIKIPKKDRILRGRVDNLFGNLVIEFERNIPKHLEEAEEQIRRYTAILWSNESPDKRTPFIGMATDGVRFMTYTPVVKDSTIENLNPDDIALNILEKIDWTQTNARDIYFWLDRYFLRKEILHPTSERIVADFGLQSHAFQTVQKSLSDLWKTIKTQSSFEVVFSSWKKYLTIVYGSNIADDQLFIRHTYLATLAKLLSWWRLIGSESLPDDDEIVRMLEGHLFKDHGIENYIDEDFFSWVARSNAQDIGINIIHWLFSLLQNFNIRELSEDILKSLYQELVDPETRHDLGEYYTPDWLAHRIVRKVLNEKPDGAILDPACGSGTFLYLTIHEKRRIFGDVQKTLNHILESVIGADIHPLAVIVAKTNYILALGDLIGKRKGKISIPVYLADTIRLPEKFMNGHQYSILLDSKTAYISEYLLNNLALYDHGITLAKDFAEKYKNQPINLELFRNFLNAQQFPERDNSDVVKALYEIVEMLKDFIDEDRDTIWAYILKNIYKPLFFKEKFDAIVGNPPWIAFRYMWPEYQIFLKKQITKDYQLLTGHGELITHIEVATLFLIKAADLYLKEKGTIAFVLPRSIYTADQHDGIRRRSFQFFENKRFTLTWRELWDCERVAPLFKVPSCVLLAEKVKIDDLQSGADGSIPGLALSGKLGRKNASLDEAEETLHTEAVEYSLNIRGQHSYWATGKDVVLSGPSYYKPKFAQGATIVPRSFWFVKIRPSTLGFNPELPPLETADRAAKMAKDAYQGLILKGNVESRFLYATLLSTDLLPFGHLKYRLMVLPIEPNGNNYRMISPESLNHRGFLHIAKWVEKVENEWANRRSAKAEAINAIDWLNYRNKLSNQNPQAKFRIIYNASGTNVVANVVKNEEIEFCFGGQSMRTNGFINDYVTYFYETSKEIEAFFLATILNAPIINTLIKPMQARGLWGPRHICKKVLELPIPQFDAENLQHRQLAELGQACTAKVKQWVNNGGPGSIRSIGKLRGMVREMLSEELGEIDGVVEGMMK